MSSCKITSKLLHVVASLLCTLSLIFSVAFPDVAFADFGTGEDDTPINVTFEGLTAPVTITSGKSFSECGVAIPTAAPLLSGADASQFPGIRFVGWIKIVRDLHLYDESMCKVKSSFGYTVGSENVTVGKTIYISNDDRITPASTTYSFLKSNTIFNEAATYYPVFYANVAFVEVQIREYTSDFSFPNNTTLIRKVYTFPHSTQITADKISESIALARAAAHSGFDWDNKWAGLSSYYDLAEQRNITFPFAALDHAILGAAFVKAGDSVSVTPPNQNIPSSGTGGGSGGSGSSGSGSGGTSSESGTGDSGSGSGTGGESSGGATSGSGDGVGAVSGSDGSGSSDKTETGNKEPVLKDIAIDDPSNTKIKAKADFTGTDLEGKTTEVKTATVESGSAFVELNNKLGDKIIGPIYDVKLMADGKLYRDNFGSITISLPVDAKYEGRAIRVYHRHENDLGDFEITSFRVVVSGGYATFSVTKLSEFILSEWTDVPLFGEGSEADANVEQVSADKSGDAVQKNTNSGGLLQTGDPLFNNAGALVLVVLLCIGVLRPKRRPGFSRIKNVFTVATSCTNATVPMLAWSISSTYKRFIIKYI